MKLKKKIFAVFSVLFLILSSFSVYADDDDGDDGDYSVGDFSGMSPSDDWTDDDWDAYFSDHQEDPDGWDGTSATYGQEANDWHSGDVDPDSEPFDYENYTVYYDENGDLVVLGIEDVYDEYGNFIWSYNGPGDKAEIESRVQDFFSGKATQAAGEALSEYLAAMNALEAAKASGADLQTLAELQAKVDEAKAELDFYCAASGCTYIISENGNFGAILNAEGKTVYTAGDPVIFATGEFIIDDTDLVSYGKNASFFVSRHYSSGDIAEKNLTHGIFGQGWTSNLESRIVPCYSTVFDQVISDWEDYLDVLRDYENDIEEAASKDSTCEDLYGSMKKFREEQEAELEEIKSYVEKSFLREKLTAFVRYGLPEKYAPRVGLDRVIYVQDNGGMIVFNKNEDGSYSLAPTFANCQLSLAETSDGLWCVTYLAYGAKRYYSKYGLPVLYTFKDGGKIEFFYDETFDESGYVKSTKLSHIAIDGKKSLSFAWNGNRLLSVTDLIKNGTVTYGYENEILSSVTDTDGDTRRFAYDSLGIMSRQIKADGSFVAFEFADIDGKRRTVKTTNEEGKSERFSYDTENRKMTYTDHDGKVSVYEYDEFSRTVSETHSDGSFIRYEYDEKNQLISKTDNFGEIHFSYDSDGNMTEKTYPDGTSEKWTYTDRILESYVDRDGISQKYSYNSQGLMTDSYAAQSLLYHFDYDENNRISAVTDCSGNKTLKKYDSNGNLVESVTYAKGSSKACKTEKWTYDSQNRVSSYTDGAGRKTVYSYTDHGMKTERSDGIIIEEVYSNRKLLLSRTLTDKITGEKRRISYEYDKNKNCTARYVSGTDARGKTIPKTKTHSFSYTDEGKNSRIVEHDVFSGNTPGWITEFGYSSDGALRYSSSGFYDSASDSLAYGAKNTLYESYFGEREKFFSSQDYDGHKEIQKFDEKGNVVSISEGSSVKFEAEYSPAGRLLWKKSGKEGMREYSYDSEFGFLQGEREKGGVLASFDRTEYLPDGRKSSYTDRNGRRTEYVYDGNKNLVKEIFVSGTVLREYDAIGRKTSEKLLDKSGKVIKEDEWKYEDRKITHVSGGSYKTAIILNAFGEIIKEIDGNGNEKTFEYDILGRKISETNQNGSKTRYEYNGKNQVTKIILADGNFLSYEYDSLSNRVQASDTEGILWKKTYDSKSRVKSRSERPFTATEFYDYDEYGELVSVSVNGAAKKSSKSDDGKSLLLTDFLGNKNACSYDGFSNLLSWKNSLGSVLENTYNPDGTLSLVKDFNGQSKKYSYSSDSLSVQIDFSDGDSILYEYDFAGNLVRAKNSASDLVFSYDTAGLLVSQKNRTDGTELAYSYDSAKKLVKIASQTREISYSWGKSGELLYVSDKVKTDSSLLSTGIHFVYDSMLRETLRVYDSGESVKSSYDKMGRLILQLGYDSNLNLVYVDGSVYDDAGQKIYSVNSDFSVTKYAYDEMGRLSKVYYPYTDALSKKMKAGVSDAGLYFLEGSSVSGTLSIPYADYEVLQNLCSQIALVSVQIQANEPVLAESFEYDANNNMTKRTNPYGTINYVYDSENRLLSWGDGGTATYDANGNMTMRKTKFSQVYYEYNGMNRLRSVSGIDFLNDERFERKNSYDALGRRFVAWKSESGSQKTSYIGLSAQVFETKKTFSSVVSDYSGSSSAKTRTARVLSDDDSRSGRYVFIGEEDSSYDDVSVQDEGSPQSLCPLYGSDGKKLSYTSYGSEGAENRSVLMTDVAGSVRGEISVSEGASLYSYDAFGSPVSSPARYGFVGKQFDDKCALYDFGFRDYEPSVARFSTSDPIHDGENWYGYCGGNPVGFYDRAGLEAIHVEVQTMQDMGGTILGTSETEDAGKAGCLVTAIAEALTALTGVTVTNDYVNSLISCFNGGDINWAGVEDTFGLSHTNVFTAEHDVSTIHNATADLHNQNLNTLYSALSDLANNINNLNNSLVHSWWESDHIDAVTETLEAIAKSDEVVAVIAQVCYDLEGHTPGSVSGMHFVGLETEVVTINGVQCAAVVATSKYDLPENYGGIRASSGWILNGGKVYVPLTLINRIDTVSKNQ